MIGRAVAPAPPPQAPASEMAAAPGADGALLFISYAHADNAAVQPVVDMVKDNGRDFWMDKIVHGINGSTGVMIICSPNAFESDHIKREVYLADRYRKPMLPVFIADAQPPEDFEYFFAGVQWLELFKLAEADKSAAIAKALRAV